MKSFEEIKNILKKQKKFLRKRYDVVEIAVFGSYVRLEEKKKSDLDILVGFEKPVGFFKFLELEEYLENLIGIKVDLVTRKALKPRIGKHILDEAVFV